MPDFLEVHYLDEEELGEITDFGADDFVVVLPLCNLVFYVAPIISSNADIYEVSDFNPNSADGEKIWRWMKMLKNDRHN